MAGSQPTYEELKPPSCERGKTGPLSSQPTYEELKLLNTCDYNLLILRSQPTYEELKLTMSDYSFFPNMFSAYL